MMAARIAVFIDYQNVYMCARKAFEPMNAMSSCGQIHPMALGQLLTARGPAGAGEPRLLSEVRIYTGRPSQKHDPRAYSAKRRQVTVWEAAGASVYSRTFRYPPDYPRTPAREKGIDVSLAIDFVAGAVDHAFDVGIIFSTDTDLIPALEFVAQRPGLGVIAEVAAWVPNGNAPLRVDGQHIWCHRLSEADYRTVHDPTAYARARGAP